MNTNMPRYVAVYSELRQAILRGEYPPDSFLPTENELVRIFNASKTTIRHAVQLLKEQNMVEVRQGSGTKILPLEQETVRGKKYNIPDADTAVLVRYLTNGAGEVHNTKAVFDECPSGEAAAKALGLAPGDPVFRLQRLQLVDGIPFGYMVNYLSPRTFPDLLTKGELMTDLYGFLARNYQVKVNAIEESIDVIAAGFMEAQFLQTEIKTPLLLLKRVAKDKNRVVEYCETTIRTDLFQMTIKITSKELMKAAPFYPGSV